MAGGIKGITVKIGGDTTELGKALTEAQKSSTALQKELKGVNSLLKYDPKNVSLLKQKQDLLKSSVSETENKLKALNDVLKKVDAGEVEMTEEEYRNLQREIANTEHKLNDLKKAQEEFGSVASQKVAAYGEDLKTMGTNVEQAGQRFLPASAAVAGLAGVAVKTTADFDDSMANVSAISGATGDDLLALRDKAKEMGASTKFSASESADAMSYMAMAGWKTQQMIDGLPGIMSLAAASGEDLAKTSDIVTDGLTAFGLGAEDSSRFADILAAASSNANTNVSMLGESFKYVAPVAGAMGYSAEDTSIALGLMANAGIKASSAGTSLRTMLTNMANPSANMKEAMDNLGLSLEDGEGNMKSLRDIMVDLRSGFGELRISEEEFNAEQQRLNDAVTNGEMTEKQYDKAMEKLVQRAYGAEGAMQAQNAAMLAGKTGMSGLMAIVGASDKDFEKLCDSIDNSEGSAKAMADTMQDTLNGQITNLMSALEGLAISFGEMLIPVMRDFVGFVQGVVDKLNAMDEGQRKIVLTIGLLVAAIGPVLIAVGKVMTSVGSIMTTAPKIVSTVKKIGSGMSKLWGILTANPMALVVVAIGLLVVAFVTLWNKSEAFRNFWKKLWEVIKTATKSAIDAVKNKFNDAKNAIESLKEKFSNFKSSVQDKFNSVKGAVSNAINSVKTKFGEAKSAAQGLADKFGSIKESIKSKINAAKDAVTGAIEKIKGAFNFTWSLPSLKLPHFSVSGKFGLNPPSIPKFDVSWYAKGGIFDQPTIVPTLSGLKGIGEAGPEAVAPIDKMMDYVRTAVGDSEMTSRLDKIETLLSNYLPSIRDKNSLVVLDTGAVVGNTVSRMDSSLQERDNKLRRGWR